MTEQLQETEKEEGKQLNPLKTSAEPSVESSVKSSGQVPTPTPSGEKTSTVKKPEPTPFDQAKYRRQLADARFHLLRNGVGQMLAHLKSRKSQECEKLFQDINQCLKTKLAFSSEHALEELSKQNSAFHRKITLEAMTCLTELQAQQELAS